MNEKLNKNTLLKYGFKLVSREFDYMHYEIDKDHSYISICLGDNSVAFFDSYENWENWRYPTFENSLKTIEQLQVVMLLLTGLALTKISPL